MWVHSFPGYRRSSVVLLSLAAAGALALSACSSGGGSQATTGVGAASSGPLPTVTVAEVALSTLDADIYVAQTLGFFAKAGVNVNVIDFGATATTAVVAGKADLDPSGLSSALSPINSGKGAEAVYALQNGFSGSGVYVAYNSPYKSVLDLSGKSIVSIGAGTASYGTGKAWSNYIVAHGGKAANVIPASSSGAKNNLLLSGHAAATVGQADQVMSLVDQKKIRFLVNPKSALAQSVFGPINGPTASTTLGLWGMTSWISTHTEALTRFLAGVREGDIWLQHHSVDQAATEIAKFPEYKTSGLTVQDIAEDWQQDKPFQARTLGVISPKAWAVTLNQFKVFDLPFSVTSSKFSYSSMVDMAPLTAAAALDKTLFG